ncbi:hypothetical protein [Nocardia tengchongensis]|uniref:hypothetical protein n=1 Tax=Nocardia tengchongensis TaxID=2055889 RepID=UPI0036C2821B
MTIADITVFPGVILTPSGQMPLRGATWTASDNSHEQKRISGGVIAVAILLLPFTCGLSLLLLMAAQTTVSGYIEVTVANAGRFHQTMFPVNSRQTFAEVMSRVSYARSVSW